MNAKKNRLGRGLDALLSDIAKPVSVQAQTTNLAENQGINLTRESPYRNIPLDLLDEGQFQPRTQMDDQALDELAASIRSQGLIQPILVRPDGHGRYEILAGHRRWRASQRAGLQEIPSIVREVPDQAALAVALIENIQREDLNPVEEAMGLKRLLDEFGLTHQDVATKIGRSRTAVTNLLRLLSLSPRVRAHLENGDLDMGHARALLTLSVSDQEAVSAMVINRGLTVRETEKRVRAMQQPPAAKSRVAHLAKDADILRLQTQLSDKLGAKVTIAHGRKKGKLVIEYYSLDELDGILERIK